MNSKPRVHIYGSEYCTYCVAARMLLKKKGIAYEDILVGDEPTLRRRLKEVSGSHTVPQIFIDDTPIGGFDELHAMEQSGELDRLLNGEDTETDHSNPGKNDG